MTIAQYIQAGPIKANELFAKLIETGPGALKTRERLFEELKVELELHARLEREHLVPALRKHDETKTLVPGLADDSKHVAKLLGEIDKMAKDGDEFLTKVGELKRTFQQHVRDDRKELLPVVKKALSREEADAVAGAIEADKAAVEAAKRAEANARRAEERLVREAAELEAEQLAEAAKQARQATREAKQTAAAAAELGRQSIAGAERAIQTAAGAVARASAGSARGLELSARQMGQAAKQATQGMAALADYNSAFTAAVREGAQTWMTWAQDSAAANMAGFQAMLGCRTAPELAGVQGRLVQEQIGLIMAGSRRVSEAATRTAGKALDTSSARGQAAAAANAP